MIEQKQQAFDLRFGEKKAPLNIKANPDFSFLTKPGEAFRLLINDETAVFLAVPGRFLLGFKADHLNATQDGFLDPLKKVLKEQGIDPASLHAEIGPALTFSHCPVERPVILHLLEKGYRAAGKRTSGVDYLDVPVLLFARLRELGLLPENILIGEYDTFENESLFFSRLRGEEEKNLVEAILR